MTFRILGYLISIEKLRRNKAIVPTGVPTDRTVFETITMAPKKRPAYVPSEDPNRILDGQEFTYFKRR